MLAPPVSRVCSQRYTVCLPAAAPATVSCALRAAAKLGMRCAVTGDGADELLGGYAFTHKLPPQKWKHNQRSMARIMDFGSVPLGACRRMPPWRQCFVGHCERHPP